jgi:hypothetical protein
MAIQISISNAIGSRYRGSVVPPVDPDAQAFITAAAITDPTQQAAINTLVVDLKGYSIWTKMNAIYPFVTDKTVEADIKSQMKFNLKDPRDLDVAFRLLWNGGGSWTANGYTPNGINGFADTKFIPSINANLNSHSLSYYSRTNSNATEVEIGSSTSTVDYDLLEIRTSGTTYFIINNGAPFTSVSDSNSQGFYLGNRTALNDIDGWKNGVKLINGTSASVARSTVSLTLGALNGGASRLYYSTKQCSFSSIGDGLTDAEALNFYTAVQAFQTTLGRQV